MRVWVNLASLIGSPLVDALEPCLEGHILLLCAWSLPEGTKVDEDAKVAHSLCLKHTPLLLERGITSISVSPSGSGCSFVLQK